jgi:hypothetical protein
MLHLILLAAAQAQRDGVCTWIWMISSRQRGARVGHTLSRHPTPVPSIARAELQLRRATLLDRPTLHGS